MFFVTLLGRLQSLSERIRTAPIFLHKETVMRGHRWTTGISTLLLTAALGFCVSSARGDFFVSNGPDHNVLRFDDAGNFISVFVASRSGGLSGPRGLTFGPDGNLYVSSVDNNRILRYDGTTGAFMDTFVPAGSGGLKGPQALIFRGDGFLYVSNFGTNPLPNFHDGKVTRYDASTGTFDSLYVSSSDTRGDCDGMTFGPNGDVFITALLRDNPDTQGVLQFDGTDGHFIGQFTQGGDLLEPRGVAFGPDGNLYVTDLRPDPRGPLGDARVARFDATTGQYIDDAVPFGQGLKGSRQPGFGPDGRLYIGGLSADEVYGIVWVFDTTTSTLDVWIDGSAGSNLRLPSYFTWN